MKATAITTQGRKRPGFYILHGVEGVGKTSFGAYIPKPIFIQTANETGLETLMGANQLPETPHFEGECATWDNLLANVAWLLEKEHDYKSLVIDTLNGAEGLCHELVVKRDFDGDNTPKGFYNYYVGPKTALKDWRRLLNGLDLLRSKRGMAILGLCHTSKRTFKNPEGADYDRWEPAFAARETWELTHRGADAVLFMTFDVTVTKEGPKKLDAPTPKGKAWGGQQRLIYTQRHATYDAKNRYGLPEEIEADGGGQAAWNNFARAMKEARNKKEE